MGEVHVLTMSIIMSWLVESLKTGDMNISIYPTMKVTPVDNARNRIVEEFKKGDFTHLLWIDADTVPPQNGLKRLLAADKDIVSGITPIIEWDERRKNSDSNGFYKKWNCVSEADQFVQPYSGIIPIKGCGGSFVLVKKEVYDKVQDPWYEFIRNDDNNNKVFIGEDISFILKSIANGFKPFADTAVICQHEKSILW